MHIPDEYSSLLSHFLFILGTGRRLIDQSTGILLTISNQRPETNNELTAAV
jgi:hypothetical protein